MAASRVLRVARRFSLQLVFSPQKKVHIHHRGTQFLSSQVLGQKIRWCTTTSGSEPKNNRTTDKHGDFQGAQEPASEEEPQESEASVKRRILDSALDFVPAFGWSVESLSEGAKVQGFPGVAHGMFPRGGGDLVHHFVRECNTQLAEKLAKEVEEEEKEEKREGGRRRRKTTPFIRDALEARLRMIIPFVEQWPQAMALTAVPANTREHFSNLLQLMDDIWYHAGDRSADFTWYTKRISLAAVYKSAELCLVQDKSTDFQETWMFIDRRLEDFSRMAKMQSDVDQVVSGVSSLIAAAFTVGRNVAGINDRNR